MYKEYVAGLIAHTTKYFEGSPQIRIWDEDRMLSFSDGIRTYEFHPNEQVEHWVYISEGVGLLEPELLHPHEYIISSDHSNGEHAELIAMLAFLISTRKRLFHIGETIDIGRPWIAGSSMSRLLVSTPYPYGPKLENAEICGRPLSLIWLLPIHDREQGFLASDGLEALEAKFDSNAIEFLDPNRASVV
ncbi:MAG: suppressor of fused domain protein [Pseudomonadota bacterium]